jgi:Flp pilus assembly protein TadG
MRMTLPFTWLKRLRENNRAVAATEFAIMAPVFFLMMMAFYDFAHSLYARTLLRGALQHAARESGLNTTQAVQDDIDQDVEDILLTANSGAVITPTRRYYKTYTKASAARHEDFTDSAVGSPFHDNICNNGESYVDANNNGVYDSDGANAGQGGASDEVLYTVKVSYPRLFPIHHFLGWSQTVDIEASTILKNQPWADQTQYGAAGVGHCT